MNRKLAVAFVLCLAVAAVLGIGAAPARAADGCTTCHTTPATGDAPAPHAPYVAGITDCTVCHTDWTGPPHPDVAKWLQLSLSGRSSDTGYQLNGRLAISVAMVPFHPGHPGVAVYLQQRLWGATEWTDLTQVTTASSPLVPGSFTFTVASPPPYATYRAIAQGHVGPLVGGSTGLFKPKRTTLLPTPELTLTLHARFRYAHTPLTPRPVSLKLGNSVTVKGTVRPADLGGKVTIRVQKRVNHKWVTHITVKRAISDTGTYSWKFTPRHRGTFRVNATIPATEAHNAVGTDFELNGYGWFNVI